MDTDKLKELLVEFGSSVTFEQDLKKRTGLTSVENQKFFIKLIT